jgi:hypothetical protein
VWISSSPLKIGFPKLYDICEDRFISVAKCVGDNWQIQFRRMLSAKAFREWDELQNILRGVTLSSSNDSVSWDLTKKKELAIGYLYKFITHGE